MKKIGEVFSSAYIRSGRGRRSIDRIWTDLTEPQQRWCSNRDIIIRRAPRGAGQVELFSRDPLTDRDTTLLPFIFPPVKK